MTDARVLAAARNNARWCDLVCRTHGTSGVFAADAWTSPARTPVFYPDAVTVTPAASPTAVLARIDTATPGASVKDSFADLSLGSGFEVLFDAQWIFRPADLPLLAVPIVWAPVVDVAGLDAWARAWGDVPGLFRGQLLDDAATVVLAGSRDGAVVAGAIAFASDGVVGLTNVFAVPDAAPGSAWMGAVGASAAAFPGVPIVGYEHGDDLAAAMGVGFAATGPLRVWAARAP